jgi:hypothetical protein
MYVHIRFKPDAILPMQPLNKAHRCLKIQSNVDRFGTHNVSIHTQLLLILQSSLVDNNMNVRSLDLQPILIQRNGK